MVERGEEGEDREEGRRGVRLGKLEHAWAKPRYGHKSVRFRSPDLPPG